MRNLKIFVSLLIASSAFSMGLRSFVALPVQKNHFVGRVLYDSSKDTNVDTLTTSLMYGIDSKQTLIIGMPYRLSPSGANRQGDVSLLYRYTILRQDSEQGTKRLALLGGGIVPTDSARDGALQAGFVYTYFIGKNEIDIDAIYQKGLNNRLNSGKYDISWQHRLFPTVRPDWGLSYEINSIVELNGRYMQGNSITHQVTFGAQLINQRWVLEGGVVKDLNNANDTNYIVSFRYNF
jgi:hypothetical protein